MLFFIHIYIFSTYIIIVGFLSINYYVIIVNIVINDLFDFINDILFADITVNADVNHYFVIVGFIFVLLDPKNIGYYFDN